MIRCLGLLITLSLVTPPLWAKPETLHGTQTEKHRVIDLNGFQFLKQNKKKTASDHYEIPEGNTLQFIGRGGHPMKATDNFIITVRGKLVFGDMPTKRKKKPSTIDWDDVPAMAFGKGYFILDGPKAEVHVNNVKLGIRFAHQFTIKSGSVHIKNSYIDTVKSNGTPTLFSAENSVLEGLEMDFIYPNSTEAKKRVRIINCVIGETTRIGIGSLWGMKGCDIYGKVFKLGHGWKKASKSPTANYFDDKEYVVFLRAALKQIRGFAGGKTSGEYNKKLGYEPRPKKKT